VSTAAVGARATLRRFWPLTGPDRPAMAVAAVLMIVAAAADTVAVLMFSDIVDGAVADGSMAAYWRPAGIWAGVAVLGAVTTALGSYLSARAAERFLLRLRNEAFTHLQRLSPDFFARHTSGDLAARLSGDVEVIESFVSSGMVSGLVSAVTVLFFAGAAFSLRWELALVMLALLPVLVLLTRRFSGRFRTTSQDERASNGAISSVVQEGVAQVALVQAYATERAEAARMHARGDDWLRARLAQMRLSSIYTPLTDLFEAFGILAVLGVGAWEISLGRLTIGGLVAFATFLGFLYSPLHALSGLFLTVGAARASADRLTEVLDARPLVGDHGGLTVPARRGHVTLDGVTFAYPGVRPVLDRVSFDAAPGRLVLVTGRSGAGKSTVARLLLRFYDPAAGRILLDGVDLRGYSLTALRQSITLLPQETAILEGTAAENIAYGSFGPDLTADRHRIAAAARAAHAEEFIVRLPQGYDTVLGSGGLQLSGGQRQRIAIARALLRDTPVLVLDEPTTGLDAESTAAVLPALRTLMRGRTTILITHDLALAPLADTVVVLDDGRVAEVGTHGQLLAHEGLYRRLAGKSQASESQASPAPQVVPTRYARSSSAVYRA
jgi:ATP-binding cassette subfamily B protein